MSYNLNDIDTLEKFSFDFAEARALIKSKSSFSMLYRVLMQTYSTIEFDDNELLYVAELYKIVTNFEICKSLDDKGKYMTYVDNEFIHLKFDKVVSKIHSLGFFFKEYDEENNAVTLVTKIGNEENNEVDMYFPECKVIIKTVTPLNYRQLKCKQFNLLSNSEQSEYDSEIAKYSIAIDPRIMFYRIIVDAIALGATDIHFLANRVSLGVEEFPIYYRIGNDTKQRNLFVIDKVKNKELIAKVIDIDTIRGAIDLDEAEGVVASVNDPFNVGGMDLRITINKVTAGYAYTVRVLGAKSIVNSLHTLGFKKPVVEVLDRITRLNSGLVLVTGPQRSGKNTTLFAVLNQMLCRPIKLMEYSSPVESLLPIPQIDYNGNVEHLNALVGTAKKHDSDIVFINELPKKETADAVYELINSSIGVLTTFHMDRIWHLPYKVDEYFGKNFMNTLIYLKYVLNQHIFIKQCPHCQDTYTLSDDSNLLPEVIEACKNLGIKTYKVSRGCEKCGGTGELPGIQPYVEYLVFDDELRDKLFEANSLYDMLKIIKNKVMTEGTNLEAFVVPDIENGTLHPNQLASLYN